jgi:beta-glucosidase
MAKRTYRYFDGEPLYPFGYGLSYTTFSYTNAQLSKRAVAADGSVDVSVEVANIGKMAGDEVVELYLTHLGIAGAPLRALKGFRRVHLDPNQRATVSFTLRERDLSIVDENGKHRVAPGTVRAWIGGGQPMTAAGRTRAAGAKVEFQITSEATLPD